MLSSDDQAHVGPFTSAATDKKRKEQEQANTFVLDPDNFKRELALEPVKPRCKVAKDADKENVPPSQERKVVSQNPRVI